MDIVYDKLEVSNDNIELSKSPDWLSRSRIPSSPHNNFRRESDCKLNSSLKRMEIFDSNYSRSFFLPILVANKEERNNALIRIIEVLENSIKYDNDLIESHIDTIIHLSTDCPSIEVRKTFQSFLNKLKTMDLDFEIPNRSRRFSSFFTSNESSLPYLLENDNIEEEFVSRLCQFTFLNNGIMTNLVQLLGWHPVYLDKFFQTFDHLMYDSGPLTTDWCCYIGILASSRHFCNYLVETQEREFLDYGGDESWLQGLNFIPDKVKSLSKINEILAHQPWRLESHHIEELCSSKGLWNINELIHAIIIMTTFHSLCSVVWSCGLLPEESNSLNNRKMSNDKSSSSEDDSNDNTLKLLEALNTSDDSDIKTSIKSSVFEKADTGNIQSPNQKRLSGKYSLSKYRGNYLLTHEDFIINSSEYLVFHVSDYSWEDQGYAMINEYFPSITPLLDDQFKTIYNLTYETFSNRDGVDTSRFRMAVWHYVHRVLGLYYDDYCYDKVNFWLNIRLKKYIKKLVCFPREVKKTDFQNMAIDLTIQEKVHLTLLASESRKQAGLLYGLRAITKYRAESSRAAFME